MDATGAAKNRRAGGTGAPRIPGLQLLRLLGTGGQGEVWLADELATGEEVAVKVGRDRAVSVPRSPSPGAGPRHRSPSGDAGTAAGALMHGHPDVDAAGHVSAGGDTSSSADAADRAPSDDVLNTRRIAREVALLRRIDHPHVVRLRRVVDLPGGSRALVLDHAAGGSLAAVVGNRGPLDPAEACTVVVPLARTLAELHERGLVHGDLTPSNVLFTGEGRPLIADLGCARIMGEAPGEWWGSDGYADPACQGRPGPSADVFALGAVLRFALTGDPATRPSAGGDPRPPQEALLALADLCTAAEPSRRPDLRSVSRIALASVSPAPVHLVTAPAPQSAPAPPAGAGSDVASRPDRSAAASGSRAHSAAGSTSKPVVVRINAPVRRPRSAAEAGWTRSPDKIRADAPTSSTAVPATFQDVLGSATTRRRTGHETRRSSIAQRSRDRRSGPDGRARSRSRGVAGLPGPGWMALVLLAGSVACWWMLEGTRNAGEVSRAGHRTAVRAAAPETGIPGQSSSVEREPIATAVDRLADGRATAFRELSDAALTLVDEPGSAAYAADRALIGRLRAAGIRLEGLSFDVHGVHPASTSDGALTVRMIVMTSAHRQVRLDRSRPAVPVAAGSPRPVLLELVAAPDGVHWLIRRTWSDQ